MFVELLGVAKEWGVPPLTALGGRPPVWRQDDTLLAAAHSRYMSERVGPSGYPKRVATDPEVAGQWNVDDETEDYAQTALNEWDAKRASGDRKAIIPRVFQHKIIAPWER